MQVLHYLLPTQYIVLRITEPADTSWGEAVKAVATCTDDINHVDFTQEIDLTAGEHGVLRIGPFRNGAAFDITVSFQNEDEDEVSSETVPVTINNQFSPAAIIRQALFDILAAAQLSGVFVLHNGLHGPATAAEDIPYTGDDIAVEIDGPATTKRKLTPIRSKADCRLDVRVYVFGDSSRQAMNIADTTLWQIQRAIDDAKNLHLNSLGVNDFSWQWEVQPPDVLEVHGGTIPVVTQEAQFTCPVICIHAPAQ